MRYEKGHKEATRQRIVEVAAAEFRRNGIEGIGVADLMAKAGLTHGGFYSHFKSKEELVRAAMEEAAGKSRMRRIAAEGGTLEDIVRSYLRPDHRDQPERGCAIAALVAEIGRHSQATRKEFTAGIERLLGVIESRLPEGTRDRRETAIGVFSLIMGALQLARTVNDKKLSDQIIEAGIQSALNLANK
ncbi:MAG TPA: TetR/AcrR family transcriptional regulator [Candidatus Methylacidiphilales bacterium]|jgi:AcrR family transcriptional regulator|nr:TetR/AcrR family transcriptional regulator [Candidatus Methylacidiphilales bacterium]